MKKFAAMIAAALVALLGVVALAPSAQAYPTPILTLKLSVQTVVSGGTFNAVATADVQCDTMTVTWNGQTATAPGSTVSHVFTAPVVQVATVITAHATCTYTDQTGTAGHALAVTQKTLTADANVTVLPQAAAATGKLPNTGGPSIGWLLAGIAALLAGAGAMYAGRRREGGASL